MTLAELLAFATTACTLRGPKKGGVLCRTCAVTVRVKDTRIVLDLRGAGEGGRSTEKNASLLLRPMTVWKWKGGCGECASGDADGRRECRRVRCEGVVVTWKCVPRKRCTGRWTPPVLACTASRPVAGAAPAPPLHEETVKRCVVARCPTSALAYLTPRRGSVDGAPAVCVAGAVYGKHTRRRRGDDL